MYSEKIYDNNENRLYFSNFDSNFKRDYVERDEKLKKDIIFILKIEKDNFDLLLNKSSSDEFYEVEELINNYNAKLIAKRDYKNNILYYV